MARDNIFTKTADFISSANAQRKQNFEANFQKKNRERLRQGKKERSLSDVKRQRRKNIGRAVRFAMFAGFIGYIAYSQSDYAQRKRNEENLKKHETYQKEVDRQRKVNAFNNGVIEMTNPTPLSDTTITWEQAVKSDTIKVEPTANPEPKGSLSDRLKNIQKRQKATGPNR